jgi:two-component system LytT family sensor kinase
MNLIIKIMLHLFYWIVFCLFAGLVSFRLAYGFGFIAQNVLAFLYNLVWAGIQFYAFYFFFYRLIEKQQYVNYFIWSVIVSVSLSVAMSLLFYTLMKISFGYTLMEFLPQIVGTFIIGQTGSLLKGFISWFEDTQNKQKIEKLLLQNELDILNAQLNPHFLFNTLNNIDSLIHSNPGKASELLIILSAIMRYMLYEAKKTKVALKGEIIHYQNIIRLQLLRLEDPSRVQFKVYVEDESVRVAPLLFLPFLENAFKYVTFDSPGSAIEIELKSARDKIEFSCTNSYKQNDKIAKQKTGGIGLSNLKRRLGLLYPAKHTLEIHDENSYFSAKLTVEL